MKSSMEITNDMKPGSDAEMESRHSAVQELAREFSHNNATLATANAAEGGKHIFGSDDPESPLNPSGTKFNAHTWVRNVARVAQENGQKFRRVGLCFQDLNVFGYGSTADYQKTVANLWLTLPGLLARHLLPNNSTSGKTRVDILRRFDGILRPGEMCVVLGPPGSGCSTFLKTISGDRNGIYVNQGSYLNYQGISDKEMHTAHRGDAIYTAETDVHFPMLTVGETLTFASYARCQRELPPGITRKQSVALHITCDGIIWDWQTNCIFIAGTASTSATSSWPCMASAIRITPRLEMSLSEACQEENASV